MYPKNTSKASLLALLTSVALYSQTVMAADPASSIGKSSSSSVSISQIFERITGFGETFVDIIGVFAVLIGSYVMLNSLVKIIQINAGKAQGSVPLHLAGMFIAGIIMGFSAWSFFLSGTIMGHFFGS